MLLGNLIATACSAILLLGGIAVLTQCRRAELSWRAFSGFALLTAGATILVDLVYDDHIGPKVLTLAVCMAIPVARILVPYRHEERRHERRVTGVGLLDSKPLERDWSQRGRARISHLLVAVFVGLVAAMVYGTAWADPAPCEFRTDLGYAKGYSDGCLWAGWVCAPKDEWSDYTLGRSVVEIAALPGMLLTMADGSHADLVAMRTRQLIEMACFTPAVRDRIEALRPLSRWVTASNAGRDSRPVYHALPGEQLGAQYASNVAVAPVGWPCDPASLRAVKGASVYGRPKGWKGDMVTLCRLR